MNDKKILHNFVAGSKRFFLWVLVLPFFLGGCGVRDSAIVLPLEDGRSAKEDAIMWENEDAVGNGIQDSGETNSPNSARYSAEDPTICVYVCGEVQNPGVVELPEGSRAWDALVACGGFTGSAKEDFVNLAAYIEDGEKIFFPSKEEAEALQQAEIAAGSNMVNINTAGVAELVTLPGIGESRAQDIVNFREKNGPFERTEDLKQISGIKDSVYEKLCDKVTVGK